MYQVLGGKTSPTVHLHMYMYPILRTLYAPAPAPSMDRGGGSQPYQTVLNDSQLNTD